MQHPHLQIGQAVNYVDSNGKNQKGKIIAVLGEHAATIELSKNSTAVADFNDKGEPGTFHFAEEKAAEAKASATSGSK